MATLCDEAPSSVIALVGCAVAGRIIVPLDPASPVARLRVLLEDSSASLCLSSTDAASDQLTAQLGEAGQPLLLRSLDDMTASARTDASSPGLVHATGASTCHLIYTSGSTGLPKAVVVTHASVLAYCRAKQAAHRLSHGAPSSRVLLASAHTWDPFLGDVFSSLACGACLVAAPRASVVHDLASTLVDGHVTHVLATPALWSLLTARGPQEVPELVCVALGGEPLPHALAALTTRMRRACAAGQREAKQEGGGPWCGDGT